MIRELREAPMQPPPLVYRGEEAPEKPGWPTSISNSAGGLTALACTAVTSNAAGTARTPRGAGSQTVRLVSSEVLLGPTHPLTRNLLLPGEASLEEERSEKMRREQKQCAAKHYRR
jgi:hypothetical protein